MSCRPIACLVVPAWRRASVTDPSSLIPFMTAAARRANAPNPNLNPNPNPNPKQ